MPTIYHAGFEFDLAESDGEILDARLDSRDELIAHEGGDWPDGMPVGMPDPVNAPRWDLERWAMRYYADSVQREIDWPLEPLSAQYGCGPRGVAEPV